MQLTGSPPAIACTRPAGEWASGDDRQMLRAIYAAGAAHDYELDWGALVPGRSAAQVSARRRSGAESRGRAGQGRDLKRVLPYIYGGC